MMINEIEKYCQEPCVMTIGKFESIHIAHKKLIENVVQRATELNICSTVFSICKNPNAILSDRPYMPLFTEEERLYMFNELRVKNILEVEFTKEFANISGEDFCNLIFNKCRVRELFVGENFKFGKNRSADVLLLKDFAKNFNAVVNIVPVLSNKTKDEAISTSTIRQYISNGDISMANKYLGYEYFIMGKTVKGKQIGRTIDFPTVNIIPEKLVPLKGVYSTLFVHEGKQYKSITNIGKNPTLQDNKNISVETFVLKSPTILSDYDFYGRNIIIKFIDFIRPEMKFSGVDELTAQIRKDIAMVDG